MSALGSCIVTITLFAVIELPAPFAKRPVLPLPTARILTAEFVSVTVPTLPPLPIACTPISLPPLRDVGVPRLNVVPVAVIAPPAAEAPILPPPVPPIVTAPPFKVTTPPGFASTPVWPPPPTLYWSVTLVAVIVPPPPPAAPATRPLSPPPTLLEIEVFCKIIVPPLMAYTIPLLVWLDQDKARLLA